MEVERENKEKISRNLLSCESEFFFELGKKNFPLLELKKQEKKFIVSL